MDVQSWQGQQEGVSEKHGWTVSHIYPCHVWWDECHPEQGVPAEAVPAAPQRQQHAALLQVIP